MENWPKPQICIQENKFSLNARDQASLCDFPPNLRKTASLLHTHYDNSQLTCKHHHRLKHVRPDDCFQSTLLATPNIGQEKFHEENSMLL